MTVRGFASLLPLILRSRSVFPRLGRPPGCPFTGRLCPAGILYACPPERVNRVFADRRQTRMICANPQTIAIDAGPIQDYLVCAMKEGDHDETRSSPCRAVPTRGGGEDKQE